MKRCENCGSDKTARGRELTGRYCSPDCMAQHKGRSRMRGANIIGVDCGSGDYSVETHLRREPDGSLRLIGVATP